jgi:hypothetical protein
VDIPGTATVHGNLVVYGSVSNATAVTRYVPISVADMLHTTAENTGDSLTGIQFPAGAQSGGSITFPLPTDYVPGTTFNLDLYLIPTVTAAGNINFWVRWAGRSTGAGSGTGNSVLSAAAPAGAQGTVQKQSFTLPAFSGTLPEYVLLTIRRDNADTYGNVVVLTALRLSYQSSR